MNRNAELETVSRGAERLIGMMVIHSVGWQAKCSAYNWVTVGVTKSAWKMTTVSIYRCSSSMKSLSVSLPIPMPAIS